MLNIESLWANFAASGFYQELGLPTPELEGLAYHDLTDHGISPYKGAYILTSFKGEVLAQINNRARCYIWANIKCGQKIWDFDWLEANHLIPFSEGVPVISPDGQITDDSEDYSSEYALLDKAELKQFYKDCLEFWRKHPLRDELKYLSVD